MLLIAAALPVAITVWVRQKKDSQYFFCNFMHLKRFFMGIEIKEPQAFLKMENTLKINNAGLTIYPAKSVDPEYFRKLLSDAQELLKEVNTSYSTDIIAERNS